MLIYDGTIPFQYLKTVVAMQEFTHSESDSQSIFFKISRTFVRARE